MTRTLFLLASFMLQAPACISAQHLDCSHPAVLRISKVGPALVYQVNRAKPHKLYALGEASEALRDCTPERPLFVVAAPEVPVGSIQVPGKEQIDHVRYFVQFAKNDFWELGTDHYYRWLPFTPDIMPEPAEDHAPPPTTHLKGNK